MPLSPGQVLNNRYRIVKLLYFKLHHTNLPRVHDDFVLPGQGMYLVMDYIEGEDLGTMLPHLRPAAGPQSLHPQTWRRHAGNSRLAVGHGQSVRSFVKRARSGEDK
jgi:serine/threonine protein kinase